MGVVFIVRGVSVFVGFLIVVMMLMFRNIGMVMVVVFIVRPGQMVAGSSMVHFVGGFVRVNMHIYQRNAILV